VQNAGADPAVLDDCPLTVARPGDLPPRAVFALPDGRRVVLESEANARENMLVRGAVAYRGAWLGCRSVVIYVRERDARLKR
jgi:hypothetical protein